MQDSFHWEGEPKDLLSCNEKQKQVVVGWVPHAGHSGKCEKPSCCPGGLLWSPNWEPGSEQVARRKEYDYMSLILIHLPPQTEVWKYKQGIFSQKLCEVLEPV